MATENKNYEKHSFKSFLEQYHVVIPMVQRDYAQGRTTDDVNRVRNRFLDAIKSYLVKSDDDNEVMKMDFIYGEKASDYFIFAALVCSKEMRYRRKSLQVSEQFHL